MGGAKGGEVTPAALVRLNTVTLTVDLPDHGKGYGVNFTCLQGVGTFVPVYYDGTLSNTITYWVAPRETGEFRFQVEADNGYEIVRSLTNSIQTFNYLPSADISFSEGTLLFGLSGQTTNIATLAGYDTDYPDTSLVMERDISVWNNNSSSPATSPGTITELSDTHSDSTTQVLLLYEMDPVYAADPNLTITIHIKVTDDAGQEAEDTNAFTIAPF